MRVRFVVTRAVVFAAVWSAVLIVLVAMHVQMEEHAPPNAPAGPQG